MVLDLFTSLEDLGNPLHVRVTPKAAKNQIKLEQLSDGTKLIRVYVTVAAEGGKANAAVITLLAKALSLPKSAFTIKRGIKSKDKVICLNL